MRYLPMLTRILAGWVALVLVAPVTACELHPERGDDQSWQFVATLERQGVENEFEEVAASARSHEVLEVQLAAIQLLSRLCPEESHDIFRTVLRQESEYLVQVTAAQALARLHDAEGFTALRDFLSEAQPPGDLHIARRLAEVGDVGGYSLVVDAARDESAARRADAAFAIPPFIGSEKDATGEIATEQVTPTQLLIELARDRQPEVQIQALENLSVAIGFGLPCSSALEILEELAEQASCDAVAEAAERIYAFTYPVCQLHHPSLIEKHEPPPRPDE